MAAVFFDREKRTSLQSQVGAYLIKEQPNDALTTAVNHLVATPAWTEARAYRNAVVHEQSPSVGLTLTLS